MEWEKLDAETTLAYEWFCRYRDYGPERSLAKVVQEHGKKKNYVRQLEVWSRRFSWVARATSYDVHIEEKKRLEKEGEQVRAAKEHIRLADSFMEVVWEALPKLRDSEINALQLRSLAEFAVKTKRDALGIAEKHDVSGSIDVNDKVAVRISEEVLEKTKRLLALRGETDEVST